MGSAQQAITVTPGQHLPHKIPVQLRLIQARARVLVQHVPQASIPMLDRPVVLT